MNKKLSPDEAYIAWCNTAMIFMLALMVVLLIFTLLIGCSADTKPVQGTYEIYDGAHWHKIPVRGAYVMRFVPSADFDRGTD